MYFFFSSFFKEASFNIKLRRWSTDRIQLRAGFLPNVLTNYTLEAKTCKLPETTVPFQISAFAATRFPRPSKFHECPHRVGNVAPWLRRFPALKLRPYEISALLAPCPRIFHWRWPSSVHVLTMILPLCGDFLTRPYSWRNSRDTSRSVFSSAIIFQILYADWDNEDQTNQRSFQLME